MKIEYYCSFSLSTVFSKQGCGVTDAPLLSSKNQENQGSEPLGNLGSSQEVNPVLGCTLVFWPLPCSPDLQCVSSREKWMLPAGIMLLTLAQFRRSFPPSLVEEQPGKGGRAGAKVADVQSCGSLCFTDGSHGNPRTLTYAVIASHEHQSK